MSQQNKNPLNRVFKGGSGSIIVREYSNLFVGHKASQMKKQWGYELLQPLTLNQLKS